MNPKAQRGSSPRRWINRIALGAAFLLASPLVAPQLLAFPHQATIRGHQVYSEQPIGSAVESIIASADQRVLRDPIGRSRPLDQPVFLTDGGWRWQWLAISARRYFAISRPIGEPVIVNRSDPGRDVMTNASGATRRLSDVLAHEFTHGAIRARFGQIPALLMPAELVEGYADHVAGSSTLSDAQALALLASGKQHPALTSWEGRKKVERALAANGGDTSRLFEEWR